MLDLFPFLSVLTAILIVAIFFLYNESTVKTPVSCSMHWEPLSVHSTWNVLFLSPCKSEKTEKDLKTCQSCGSSPSGSQISRWVGVLCATTVFCNWSLAPLRLFRGNFVKPCRQLKNNLPVKCTCTHILRYRRFEIPFLKVRKCCSDQFRLRDQCSLSCWCYLAIYF